MNQNLIDLRGKSFHCQSHDKKALAYCSKLNCKQRILCISCIKSHSHDKQIHNIEYLFKQPPSTAPAMDSYPQECRLIFEQNESLVRSMGKCSDSYIQAKQDIDYLKAHPLLLTVSRSSLIKDMQQTFDALITLEKDTVSENHMFTELINQWLNLTNGDPACLPNNSAKKLLTLQAKQCDLYQELANVQKNIIQEIALIKSQHNEFEEATQSVNTNTRGPASTFVNSTDQTARAMAQRSPVQTISSDTEGEESDQFMHTLPDPTSPWRRRGIKRTSSKAEKIDVQEEESSETSNKANSRFTSNEIEEFLTGKKKMTIDKLEEWLKKEVRVMPDQQAKVKLVKKELLFPKRLLEASLKSIDRPTIDITSVNSLFDEVLNLINPETKKNLLAEKLDNLQKAINAIQERVRQDVLDRLKEKDAVNIIQQMNLSKVDFKPEIEKLTTALQITKTTWPKLKKELDNPGLQLKALDQLIGGMLKLEIVDQSFAAYYKSYFKLKSVYPRLCCFNLQWGHRSSENLISRYLTLDTTPLEADKLRQQLNQISLEKALELQLELEPIKNQLNFSNEYSNLTKCIEAVELKRRDALASLEKKEVQIAKIHCIHSKLFFAEMSKLRECSASGHLEEDYSTSQRNQTRDTVAQSGAMSMEITNNIIKQSGNINYNPLLTPSRGSVSNSKKDEDIFTHNCEVQDHAVSRISCSWVLEIASLVREALQAQDSPKLDAFVNLILQAERSSNLTRILAKTTVKHSDAFEGSDVTQVMNLQKVLDRVPMDELSTSPFLRDLHTHFLDLYIKLNLDQLLYSETRNVSDLQRIYDNISQLTKNFSKFSTSAYLSEKITFVRKVLTAYHEIKSQNWRKIVEESLFGTMEELESSYEKSELSLPEIEAIISEYKPLFAEGKKLQNCLVRSHKYNLPNLKRLLEKFRLIFKQDQSRFYLRLQQKVGDLEQMAAKNTNIRTKSTGSLRQIIGSMFRSANNKILSSSVIQDFLEAMGKLVHSIKSDIKEVLESELELENIDFSHIESECDTLCTVRSIVQSFGLTNPTNKLTNQRLHKLLSLLRKYESEKNSVGFATVWAIASYIMLELKKVPLPTCRTLLESSMVNESSIGLSNTDTYRKLAIECKKAERLKKQADVVVKIAKTWRKDQDKKQLLDLEFVQVVRQKLDQSRVSFKKSELVIKSLAKAAELQEVDLKLLIDNKKVFRKDAWELVGRIQTSAIFNHSTEMDLDDIISRHTCAKSSYKALYDANLYDPAILDAKASECIELYNSSFIRNLEIEQLEPIYQRFHTLYQAYVPLTENSVSNSTFHAWNAFEQELTDFESKYNSTLFSKAVTSMTVCIWSRKITAMTRIIGGKDKNTVSRRFSRDELQSLLVQYDSFALPKEEIAIELTSSKDFVSDLVTRRIPFALSDIGNSESISDLQSISGRFFNAVDLGPLFTQKYQKLFTESAKKSGPNTPSTVEIIERKNNRAIPLPYRDGNTIELSQNIANEAEQQMQNTISPYDISPAQPKDFTLQTSTQGEIVDAAKPVQIVSPNVREGSKNESGQDAVLEPPLVKKIKDSNGIAISVNNEDIVNKSQYEVKEDQFEVQLKQVVERRDSNHKLKEGKAQELINQLLSLKSRNLSTLGWKKRLLGCLETLLEETQPEDILWKYLESSGFRKDFLEEAVLEKTTKREVLRERLTSSFKDLKKWNPSPNAIINQALNGNKKLAIKSVSGS